MVADETITGFGRMGDMFTNNRYNVVPDLITPAKVLSSGYAPIGAVISREGFFETFNQTDNMFTHGFTYSGHAVSAAIALANLEIMENENLCGYVRENEAAFHSILKRLLDIPIVGDVRGAGFFYGIELVKNQATKESFSDEESERILKNFISRELLKEGLYCRADDRGEPVVQLSPPLITTISQMEDVEAILRKVLTQAASMV